MIPWTVSNSFANFSHSWTNQAKQNTALVQQTFQFLSFLYLFYSSNNYKYLSDRYLNNLFILAYKRTFDSYCFRFLQRNEIYNTFIVFAECDRSKKGLFCSMIISNFQVVIFIGYIEIFKVQTSKLDMKLIRTLGIKKHERQLSYIYKTKLYFVI